MKNLFALVCVLTLVSATVAVAQQQCGSSCGTNQCGLLNQKVQTDPVPVPEITPTNVKRVAIDDDKVTGYNAGPKVTYASTRVVEAQPVSGNFALFGANINRQVAPRNDNVEAMLDNLNRKVSDLQTQVVDERIRGNEIDTTRVKEAILAEIMSPDELFTVVSQSPRFQGLIKEIMEKQTPDVVWTVEPVTD